MQELLLETRRTYNRAHYGGDDETCLIDRCGKHTVLILDDLGAEKPTEWTRATLYLIINHRYEADLKMFITSNLDLDEIARHLDDRISNRLAEMFDAYRLPPRRALFEMFQSDRQAACGHRRAYRGSQDADVTLDDSDRKPGGIDGPELEGDIDRRRELGVDRLDKIGKIRSPLWRRGRVFLN